MPGCWQEARREALCIGLHECPHSIAAGFPQSDPRKQGEATISLWLILRSHHLKNYSIVYIIIYCLCNCIQCGKEIHEDENTYGDESRGHIVTLAGLKNKRLARKAQLLVKDKWVPFFWAWKYLSIELNIQNYVNWINSVKFYHYSLAYLIRRFPPFACKGSFSTKVLPQLLSVFLTTLGLELHSLN